VLRSSRCAFSFRFFNWCLLNYFSFFSSILRVTPIQCPSFDNPNNVDWIM
jgi:hypothetical protein